MNDTHSLRLIPTLSGDGGVKKYELPIMKESKSYTFTEFAEQSEVRSHAHDEAQLRIITCGTFDFIVGGKKFENLQVADWIYIPEKTTYSISCPEGGALITGYGQACDCSDGT